MVELTIGSRFWYKDKLCEVVEGECFANNCVYKHMNKCIKVKAKCSKNIRYDKKNVYFKEVKE